jgi:hypothetical protein
MEASHFYGYKLNEAGVHGGMEPGPQKVIFTGMVMIDI